MINVFDANSRSQGSLSRLEQDGADGEASLSKMDIVLSFTLEVFESALLIHRLQRVWVAGGRSMCRVTWRLRPIYKRGLINGLKQPIQADSFIQLSVAESSLSGCDEPFVT